LDSATGEGRGASELLIGEKREGIPGETFASARKRPEETCGG